LEPSAEIQRLEHRPAEREWAEKLGLRENAPVVVMRRLRKADGQPIALAWNVFIEEQVGQTLESGIWQDSIFLHMETRCGVKIASARALISALRPDCPYDRLAKETLGDSALLMRRLHFDLKGAPVLYSLDYIRTDLVDLIVRQQRGFY
jgi:GntR family transcriptional regulator